jgi:hypothetical protein
MHGLVYAHECALLVNYRIHDAKKNPGGRTRYHEKYWNPIFLSPKCAAKDWVTPGTEFKSRGLSLKLQDSAQAVNWSPDPLEAPDFLTKIP